MEVGSLIPSKQYTHNNKYFAFHIQIFATIEVFSFISFQLVDTKLDAVSIHNYYFVRLVMS